VKRTLLEFHLAGVAQDAATRVTDPVAQRRDHKLSTEFQRNTQDSQLKVAVKTALNSTACRTITSTCTSRRRTAAALSPSDSPDVTPVLNFANNADLRRRMSLAYNNRAYPQNIPVLTDI